MTIVELLTVAKKINNFVINATTNFDSTTQHDLTVPVGKRWFVLGGNVKRDVSSTSAITVLDSSGFGIMILDSQSAAASTTQYPSNVTGATIIGAGAYPIIVNAGETIRFSFGTAQGAGAFLSCTALEIDV